MASIWDNGPSMALFTDLYQLTMAYGYWKSGLENYEAVFHVNYRTNPFGGGFALACGLQNAIEFLSQFRFHQDDIDYLSCLKGYDNKPLLSKEFLDYLLEIEFCCDVDAVPEGTPVFPYEPLVRVKGPLLQSQILESALLNIINFQSLIATKAARICMAARSHDVMEFGIRRAQGIDGALSASRAAFIGGCNSTSHLLAGKLYGIPVSGTQAHSWIMVFDSEEEAFLTYAKALPNNCVFLVDTYNSIEGVKKAIKVAGWLKEQGYKLLGIRLDSGDLAYLSIESRKLLDAAGLKDARIIASNELDEFIIQDLMRQGAKIAVWGVGTNLVTGKGCSALDGIYKISAVRKHKEAEWQDKIKLSEQMVKMSNPGILQIRRFKDASGYVADAIYDIKQPIGKDVTIIDPLDSTKRKLLSTDLEHEDLLVPIFREGKLVYDLPDIHHIRQTAIDQLENFHQGIKRFVYPHIFPVGLEQNLFNRKIELIHKIRK